MTYLLVKRKGQPSLKVFIDDADYDRLSMNTWKLIRKNRFVNEKNQYLHHLLFPEKNHDRRYTLEFIDGNFCNYQKQNIKFSHKKTLRSENSDLSL